jgi:hypothetical protein
LAEIEIYFQSSKMPRAAVASPAAILMRAALIAAMLGACAGGPPAATANDAARANLQLADLEHGRSLMMAKCGGCHRAPMPADHRAADWPRSLDEMSARAKLDVMQRQLIEQYLVTLATR